MRSSTLFTSLLLYAVLVTSLPQPFRPNSGKSLSLSFNVRFPRSFAENQANRDRARALAKREPPSINLSGTGLQYITTVGIGQPPTNFNLLLDTGSANTWVGAITPYIPTSSSQRTDQNMSVTYGTGSVSGGEFVDLITFNNEVTIFQSIGVATNVSDGFAEIGVDGLLGLGPADLTIGTLSPEVGGMIPTVIDNFFSEGLIKQDVFALFFEPSVNTLVNIPGTLDLGEPDLSKTTSDITFTPITQNGRASHFWGIDVTIEVGGSTILTSAPGFVDSGTSNIALTDSAFQQYLNAVNATVNEMGSVVIKKENFFKMPPLKLTVGGTTFELSPDGQALSHLITDGALADPDDVILAISNLGESTEGGVEFVLGFAWLARFYTVFDLTNHRVGFATTPLTNNVVNIPISV